MHIKEKIIRTFKDNYKKITVICGAKKCFNFTDRSDATNRFDSILLYFYSNWR